jgi:hypothetical protein
MKYQNLKATAVRMVEVSPKQTLQMWSLFREYYDDVHLEMFLKDLTSKTHVILLTRNAEILGFSTVQLYDTEVEGRTVRVIYSGDTIKSREVWGEKNLNKAFAKLLAKDYLMNLGKEYYWFLISKGYKTYLLLTNNFPNAWPKHNQEFNGFQKQLIDHLAVEKFGNAYCADVGLLVFKESKGRLKEDAVPVTSEDLKSQHIRYFLQKNPQYLKGQELCCLARVDMALWKNAVRKLILPKKKRRMNLESSGNEVQPIEAHS